jgi:hypothetical protein
MGQYIAKIMGYGLTDVEYDEDTLEVTDPRINRDVLYSDTVEDEFREWLRTEPDEVRAVLKDHFRYALGRSILGYVSDDARLLDTLTYEPEFGLPTVLHFQPFTQPDWFESDGAISTVEHWIHHDKAAVAIDALEESNMKGFWPYNAGSMYRHPDVSTPEALVDSQSEDVQEALDHFDVVSTGRIPGGLWDSMTGADELVPEPQATPELREHFLTDWNVEVPRDLRLFAYKTGIFNDFNTVYRLRPLIYTYWS